MASTSSTVPTSSIPSLPKPVLTTPSMSPPHPILSTSNISVPKPIMSTLPVPKPGTPSIPSVSSLPHPSIPSMSPTVPTLHSNVTSTTPAVPTATHAPITTPPATHSTITTPPAAHAPVTTPSTQPPASTPVQSTPATTATTTQPAQQATETKSTIAPGLENIQFTSISHRTIPPVSECYRIKKIEHDNYHTIEQDRLNKCQTQLLYIQNYLKLLMNNFKLSLECNKKLLNYYQKVMAENRKLLDDTTSVIKVVDVPGDMLSDELFKKLTTHHKSEVEKIDTFMKGIQAEIYPLIEPLIKSYSDKFNNYEGEISKYISLLSQTSRNCQQFFDQLMTSYQSVKKFESKESSSMNDLLPDLVLYYGQVSVCLKLFNEYNKNLTNFLKTYLDCENERHNTIKESLEKYVKLCSDFGKPLPADLTQIPSVEEIQKRIKTQVDDLLTKIGDEKVLLLDKPIIDNLPNLLDSNLIVKHGTVALFKGNDVWLNTTGLLSIDNILYLYVLDSGDLNVAFQNDKEKFYKSIQLKSSEYSRTEGYKNTLTINETITTLKFFKTNNKYFINIGEDIEDWIKSFHDLSNNRDPDEGPINL